MDFDKINAMADVMEQGHEVTFDSPEEAKQVELMLNTRHASKRAQNPAAPVQNFDSFAAGAKPGILDYAPALKIAGDALTGNTSPHGDGAFGSKWQQIKDRHDPKEWDDFMLTLQDLPEKERTAIMHDMMKFNYKKEIEENQKKRRAAQVQDPQGYGLGQAASSLGLGIAGGAAAGPEIAGQGLAGMATNFAMDPSPSSALAGGIAGAGSAGIAGAVAKPINAAINKAASPGFGDDMLAKWLQMDPKEIALAKANGSLDDILSVVRSNTPGYGNAQKGFENIELPAIDRGAEGTIQDPLVGPKPGGQIDAEMAPMPTKGPRQQHPNSWMKPTGQSREIDLGMPSTPTNTGTAGEFNDALANANSGNEWVAPRSGGGEHLSGDELYSRASNADLDNMMPSHPSARGAEAPLRRIPPPQAQNVKLDVIDEPSTPPLSPPERDASAYLQRAAKAGQSNPSGLVTSPKSGIFDAMKQRAAPLASIGLPAIAQKMQSMVATPMFNKVAGGAVGGMSRATSDSLLKLIRAVTSSPTPEVEDYLAQEMSPVYRAVRMEAANALDDESKENK